MNIKQILNTAVGGYSLSKILSALVTLLVCLIAVRLIMKSSRSFAVVVTV